MFQKGSQLFITLLFLVFFLSCAEKTLEEKAEKAEKG